MQRRKLGVAIAGAAATFIFYFGGRWLLERVGRQHPRVLEILFTWIAEMGLGRLLAIAVLTGILLGLILRKHSSKSA